MKLSLLHEDFWQPIGDHPGQLGKLDKRAKKNDKSFLVHPEDRKRWLKWFSGGKTVKESRHPQTDEVIKLAKQGLTPTEIGKLLNIIPNTVAAMMKRNEHLIPPEAVAKRNATLFTQKSTNTRSILQKRWADPEQRKTQSARMVRRWETNPEWVTKFKTAGQAAQKQYWETHDFWQDHLIKFPIAKRRQIIRAMVDKIAKQGNLNKDALIQLYQQLITKAERLPEPQESTSRQRRLVEDLDDKDEFTTDGPTPESLGRLINQLRVISSDNPKAPQMLRTMEKFYERLFGHPYNPTPPTPRM